ncbi:hypothetical protein MHK_007655 [Candidatus Magnetomorum sp. HK-1]|nr:hypothetical protein MHK_007655 [Candidatus Magnetomorum sp. HK-1]
MDIGDYIFFFFFILVIIGKVLSWVFNQFVEKAPATDNASPNKPGIIEKVVDWLKTLETNIAQQSSPELIQSSQWQEVNPQPLYSEIQPTPQFDFEEESLIDTNVSNKSKCKDQEQSKLNCRNKQRIRSKKLNLKKAIIHYEMIAPPLALRREY